MPPARSRLPVWPVAVGIGVWVGVALALPAPWSAVALLPVIALLATLSYLAWPTLSTPARVVRLFVLGGLTVWMLWRLLGAG